MCTGVSAWGGDRKNNLSHTLSLYLEQSHTHTHTQSFQVNANDALPYFQFLEHLPSSALQILVNS